MVRRAAALVLVVALLGFWWSTRPGTHTLALASDVAMPFTLANGHIMLPVTVNGSAPLWFVLDTGDKYAVLDLERARSLGLSLGRPVSVWGTNADSSMGAFMNGATFAVPGLPGFSQPVTLAIPLARLAPRLGQDIDGLLGADFISAFIVEIDYEQHRLWLHDRDAFRYSGPGESLPLQFNAAGFPVVTAGVTPVGQAETVGSFIVDLGANGALTLHSPFVAEHRLPGEAVTTVRAMGTGGVGGDAVAVVGRVDSVRIGHVVFDRPVVTFSHDATGGHASREAIGDIGAALMRRLRVFLDYSHARLIVEPTALAREPFDQASSGLAIEAGGDGYHVFRVADVLERSPGSEAGVRIGDIITAIDDRPASEFTLTLLLERFERAVPRRLAVRRADRVVRLTLTPRPLV